jgi:large subunit ribosomal protein L21
MFAILETGSKQYLVSEGNTVDIEKLSGDIRDGANVVFNSVLMAEDTEGKIFIGKPALTNVAVEAEILENYKDKKVTVFKIRRRKNSRRKNGHRQLKMKVRITSIKFF